MDALLTTWPTFYEIPSDVILQHRKSFYVSHKESAESFLEWFGRVSDLINGCEFGSTTQFMLMDKFISELDQEEVLKMHSMNADSLENHIDIKTKIEFEETNPFDQIVVKCEPDVWHLEDTAVNNATVNEAEDNIITPGGSGRVPMNRITDLGDGMNKTKLKSERETPPETTERLKPKNPKPTKTMRRKKGEEAIKGYEINEDNRVVCLDCNKTFGHTSTYSQHKRLVHLQKKYDNRELKCDQCCKTFFSKKSRRSHMFSHYVNSGEKSFECYLCHSTFPSYKGARIHITTIHRKYAKGPICEFCNLRLKSKAALDDHIQSVHGHAPVHKCPYCEKEFNAYRKMEYHSMSHPESKRFMCDLCGKAFNFQNKLNRHIRDEHEDVYMQCEECGKTMKRISYKTHLQTHKDRQYTCGLCNAKLLSASGYRKHMQVHRGDLPFKCNVCGKSFVTGFLLKMHSYIHTGEKPYPCTVCDKKFNQLSAMKTHRKKVHSFSEKKKQ